MKIFLAGRNVRNTNFTSSLKLTVFLLAKMHNTEDWMELRKVGLALTWVQPSLPRCQDLCHRGRKCPGNAQTEVPWTHTLTQGPAPLLSSLGRCPVSRAAEGRGWGTGVVSPVEM